ncbi:MAG: hypothetical protein QG646_193 [Euryarchaeota archaeon]|nr:hypothetical protein [Euryarchaeota archaeon]
MPKKKEDWFTNINGASQILNRDRSTVGKYIKKNKIDGSFTFGNSTLIPMSDVAKLMDTSENVVVKVAKAKSVPLWKCKR